MRFPACLNGCARPRMRRITAVDVLIFDDFALRPLDATETNDFYEFVVERHNASPRS